MVGLDDEYAGVRWAHGPGPLLVSVVGLVVILLLVWFSGPGDVPPPDTPPGVIEGTP